MKEKSYITMTYNLKVLDSKNSASDLSNIKVIDPLIREITFSKNFGGFLEFLKNHFQKVESSLKKFWILAFWSSHTMHMIHMRSAKCCSQFIKYNFFKKTNIYFWEFFHIPNLQVTGNSTLITLVSYNVISKNITNKFWSLSLSFHHLEIAFRWNGQDRFMVFFWRTKWS